MSSFSAKILSPKNDKPKNKSCAKKLSYEKAACKILVTLIGVGAVVAVTVSEAAAVDVAAVTVVAIVTNVVEAVVVPSV
jgi:hypothetical protein